MLLVSITSTLRFIDMFSNVFILYNVGLASFLVFSLGINLHRGFVVFCLWGVGNVTMMYQLMRAFFINLYHYSTMSIYIEVNTLFTV